jgi:hypothetical protein
MATRDLKQWDVGGSKCVAIVEGIQAAASKHPRQTFFLLINAQHRSRACVQLAEASSSACDVDPPWMDCACTLGSTTVPLISPRGASALTAL